jgi:hypothetical protein
MHNLYRESDVQKIVERLEKLSPEAERQWGTMDVAQMLAHLNTFLEVGLNKRFEKRMLLGRIIGGFFKKRYTSKKPFSQNSPTGKSFKITKPKDFETEKSKAIALVCEFYTNGPEKCTKQPHQFFGYLSPNEWAIVQWKHFDHHLRQFNV